MDAGRDWLYLSALLLGASIAVLTFLRPRYQRDEPPGSHAERRANGHFHSRQLVISLFILSAAIGAFAFSFVLSNGSIIRERELLVVAAILVGVSGISFRFPRFVGYPIFIAAGSALVLFAWAYLVYPQAKEGSRLGRYRSLVDGGSLVWFDSVSGGILPASGPVEGQKKAQGGAVLFELVYVDFDRRYPLVGSGTRTAFIRVLRSDTVVAEGPAISLMNVVDRTGNPAVFQVPGVTVRRELLELPAAYDSSNARTEIMLSKDGPQLIQ